MIIRKIAAALLSAALVCTVFNAPANSAGIPLDTAAAQSFSLGDVNGDTAVDSKDASDVLAEYSLLSTDKAGSFTDEKKARADLNSDGMTDSKDASMILAYYSYISTGGTKPLEEYFAAPSTTTTTTASTTSTTAATTTATTTTQKVYVEYHFRSKSLLNQHFSKHGAEFADDFGYTTAEEYERGASSVINNVAALHKTEKEDGDDVFYIESTNEFVVLSTDGYIRTYFRPDSGKKYYDKQ